MASVCISWRRCPASINRLERTLQEQTNYHVGQHKPWFQGEADWCGSPMPHILAVLEWECSKRWCISSAQWLTWSIWAMARSSLRLRLSGEEWSSRVPASVSRTRHIFWALFHKYCWQGVSMCPGCLARLPGELVDSYCSSHSLPEVTASSQAVKYYCRV